MPELKEEDMYNYDLLENGCYYLVREKENDPITLIKVGVITDHCIFVQRFDDPGKTEWKLKKDALADVIECLNDEMVRAWEKEYFNSGAYQQEDDEE